MANLVLLESFDWYNSTIPVSMRWSVQSIGSVTYQTGRFGGQCFDGIGGVSAATSIGSAQSSLSLGFAFQVDSLTGQSSGNNLIRLMNSTTVIASLSIDSTGKLIFSRGSSATSNVLASSSAGAVIAAAWMYIELEFVRHASAGSINVYINGVLSCSATAVNTGASDIDVLQLNCLSGGSTHSQFDDLYVIDAATRAGEIRISPLAPTADTAQKDLTPLSGSDNYAMVDDIPPTGDTDYVYGTTAGNKDRYAMGNLSYTPLSIIGVQTVVIARKDNVTQKTIRSNLKSGSTTVNGSTKGLSNVYQPFVDIFQTDPDTAGVWTASSVNALEAGVEIVS